MRKSLKETLEYYIAKYSLNSDLYLKFAKYQAKYEKGNVCPYPFAQEICKMISCEKGRNYLYTHRDNTAIEYLKSNGMYGYFTDFITSDQCFPRKPNPKALLYLIDKHNIDKHTALMVGDREIDIIAAKNAGIKSCLFNPLLSTVNTEADFYIETIDQLSKIIEM
jgi:HAD superfamily hydrolase (TIGR01549 family)